MPSAYVKPEGCKASLSPLFQEYVSAEPDEYYRAIGRLARLPDMRVCLHCFWLTAATEEEINAHSQRLQQVFRSSKEF